MATMDLISTNPYYGVSVLLFLPAFYLLTYRKRPSKPTAASHENGKPENPGWIIRKQYADLKLFLPFLLPKDKVIQRRLVFNLSVAGLGVATNRVIKVLKPVLLRRIIDTLNDNNSQRSPWVEIVLHVLFRNIIAKIADDIAYAYKSRATTNMSDAISLALYNKLLDQTAEYHENKRSGSVWNAVCSSGTTAIHYFSYMLFHQLPVLLDVVLSVATCWTVFNGDLALAMFAFIVLYVGVCIALSDFDKAAYDAVVRTSENASDIGHDTLLNWQTVSYFNRFEHERARYAAAVQANRRSQHNYRRPLRWQGTAKNLLAGSGVAAVCLLGSRRIRTSAGRLGAGDFVLLFQFWAELFQPLEFLVDIFVSADRFLSDSHKGIEILKLEPAVKDKQNAAEFNLENGTIEFDKVSFSYDGERDVIRDVSFTVEGGKTVAIVGETGGGKSTLFKLLCRAYDPKAGSIRIDGQDLRDVRLTSFREHVSIVPQAIGVFNTTVLENLRYANLEATREQVEDACRAAALHKRIVEFPKGYDEVVGEKGSKLSGGELQRLAIARALLRRAQIVLFDEATSNLDAETEGRIQDYLRRWYNGRTVVVVAHRLATISHADLIISFKDGAIVEAGSYEDLLARKGYFYQLWNKQRLAWDPSKEGREAAKGLETVESNRVP